MIPNKKKFYGGAAMMVAFIVVLILMFMPILNGQNLLNYLDALFNSISKGSAYYIPKVTKESKNFEGNSVSVTLTMANKNEALQTAALFEAGGAEAVAKDSNLKVNGDLGKILANSLADADAMYNNDGAKVSGKYGYDEKRVLFNWWKAFNELEKGLKKQKKFNEAKGVALVVKKALETSYNYYRIDPQKIGDRWGIVFLSLVFYVFYTLWYGFGIMFMFEGWGLELGH